MKWPIESQKLSSSKYTKLSAISDELPSETPPFCYVQSMVVHTLPNGQLRQRRKNIKLLISTECRENKPKLLMDHILDENVPVLKKSNIYRVLKEIYKTVEDQSQN